MTHRLMKRSLACLLVLCLLVVGGLASAQSITHESQHSHHQKATHGTVLCSWMCAAGQVLDSLSAPALTEQSPVAMADEFIAPTLSSAFVQTVSSRGPPTPVVA
jgi:hypothetical protein